MKKQKMSQEHLNVLNIIKSCPNDAITRKEIVLQLGYSTKYFRRLNEIINDLVVVYKEPIGSSSAKYKNGYFYCKTDNDYRLARNSLKSRVQKIKEREEVLQGLSKEVI